jgi:hypothetical protein
MRLWRFALLCLPLVAQAEELSFDVSSYEKKTYEWGGYVELTGEYLWLNRDAALYNLTFSPDDRPSSFARYRGVLELDGLYRFEKSSLYFRGHGESVNDHFGNENDASVYELYYAVRPSDRLSLEAGKRALKWGKGYAWNPVGFLERPKDPNDPDLSREGFVLAAADYVRSFDGPLKTVSFTPIILPVNDELNSDFSPDNDINFAAKLYLLYRDTDIDFYLLGKGSRSARIGADFSRNLTTNFEIHGELAYIDDQRIVTIDNTNQLEESKKDVVRALLGLRYLAQNDITWIVEYYHNGAGYRVGELKRFFDIARANQLESPVLFNIAEQARGAGYGTPNPGRDYLYLRATRKEPFDIVYLTAGLTSIVNLHDDSFSFTPELIYTGIDNSETRLKLAWLQGSSNSEFGEKLIERRVELRFRYFF